MPKKIDVPVPLDDGDVVTVKLWKRDFRNALYLVSETHLFKPDGILLSALELPAVWTVECALLYRGRVDAPLNRGDTDVQEYFDRISKAGAECHASARRIVRNELKRLAESGRHRPSSDFKLKRYSELRSFREFALVDEMGRIYARSTMLGAKWKMFVNACLESWVVFEPGQKFVIDWCLDEISKVIRDALISRDYSTLMEEVFTCDQEKWLELRDAIQEISKERYLS